jgi:hypothetical protein
MTRATGALVVGAMVVLWSAGARAEVCCCCGQPLVVQPEVDHDSIAELEAALATGIVVSVISWVFTTSYAGSQPHFAPTVDTLPIVGGITSAARNDTRDTPILLFTVGTQTIGALLAIMAGVELARERRRFDISGGISGDGAYGAVTFRY